MPSPSDYREIDEAVLVEQKTLRRRSRSRRSVRCSRARAAGRVVPDREVGQDQRADVRGAGHVERFFGGRVDRLPPVVGGEKRRVVHEQIGAAHEIGRRSASHRRNGRRPRARTAPSVPSRPSRRASRSISSCGRSAILRSSAAAAFRARDSRTPGPAARASRRTPRASAIRRAVAGRRRASAVHVIGNSTPRHSPAMVARSVSMAARPSG